MAIPALATVPALTSSTNWAGLWELYVGHRDGGRQGGTEAEIDVIRRPASAKIISRGINVLNIQKLRGWAISKMKSIP
jgi:hypothetical protein